MPSAALYEIVTFNMTQIMFFLYIPTNLPLNILMKKPIIMIIQPLEKTVQHFIFILLRFARIMKLS